MSYFVTMTQQWYVNYENLNFESAETLYLVFLVFVPLCSFPVVFLTHLKSISARLLFLSYVT